MLRLVIFAFVLHQVSGVINRLTPLEYDKLPRLTKIDEYGPCLRVPGDAYCFVDARLYGNLSDPLYNTLVEYSANTITHFDHTQLHWGICPKKSCGKHMNSSTNLTEVIEECLNETLTRDYRLTAKIFRSMCDEYSQESKWDVGDYAFGALLLGLLGLNVLGSLYDFHYGHEKNTTAGRYLLCFSVRRNWRRLAGPASSSPMQQRIKVIHCIRSITAFLVVCGHTPLPFLGVANDPRFLEEAYHDFAMHLFFNGTLIVQTFFLLSGFLMAYNMLLSEEKRPPSWGNLPKGVLLRWLRLTPPYAFTMFFVMTWMRHLSAGPFYQRYVTSEATACHQDWWLHLLYIHNYKDHSQCMAHAWYLAAEFQLSVVGLLVFCLLHKNRTRKVAIGLVMLVGLITPAVHTYVQDLHAVLIPSPEVAVNFFVEDPTFNNLYKRGHTNLVCYGLGLAMAYIIYNLKDSDIGSDKYKKYRLLYWLLFPVMLMIVLVGVVFYVDGLVTPLGVRVVYSSAVKLVFGFVTAVFIYFSILKIDRAFRGFLDWGGWARISRVTFFAYLIHVAALRFYVGKSDELVPAGAYSLVVNFLSCFALVYSLAVPLFITLESPLAELVKVALAPREKTKPESEDMKPSKESKETLEIKL